MKPEDLVLFAVLGLLPAATCMFVALAAKECPGRSIICNPRFAVSPGPVSGDALSGQRAASACRLFGILGNLSVVELFMQADRESLFC